MHRPLRELAARLTGNRRMFKESAQLYDAILDFKDYAAASRQLQDVIRNINPSASTLLDVGCGTGKHLQYLREYYQVEGLDLSTEMIEHAQKRCPEVVFHQADMVNFDLDRKFDVVTCLLGAIGYVKRVEDLCRVVDRLAAHLTEAGILVVEPWLSPEKYWADRLTANFVDEPDLKVARMYISKVEGRISIFDISYLIGRPEGITYFTERQEVALFTHEEYMESYRRASLNVSHDPKGLFGYGLYVGTKSA
jgi:SAM-dependent methyltransferase